MDWISKIPDLVKLPTKYFAMAAIITGAILFLPDDVIRRLHLEAIPKRFGLWLGLAFLVFSALVVVNIFSWCAGCLQVYRRTAKRKEIVGKHLRELDPAEKAVLREFYIADQNTIQLPMDHAVVAGLISRRIIQHVGSLGTASVAGMLCSFAISEDARELITPEVYGFACYLIDHPDGGCALSDEGGQWMMQNRPAFVGERDRHGFRSRWR